MSASERRKGADFENEICALLRDRLGVTVRRNLAQSRSGAVEGTDIVVGDYAIECKRRATIAVYQWLDQARTDAGEKIPVVIARADGRKPIAIVDLDAFIPLIQGEL